MWFLSKQRKQLKAMSTALKSNNYQSVITIGRDVLSKISKHDRYYLEVVINYVRAQYKIGNSEIAISKIEETIQDMKGNRIIFKQTDYHNLFSLYLYYHYFLNVLNDGSNLNNSILENLENNTLGRILYYLQVEDKEKLSFQLHNLENKEEKYSYFEEEAILCILSKAYQKLNNPKSDDYYRRLLQLFMCQSVFDFEKVMLYHKVSLIAEQNEDYNTAFKYSQVVARSVDKYQVLDSKVKEFNYLAAKYAVFTEKGRLAEQFVKSGLRFNKTTSMDIKFELENINVYVESENRFTKKEREFKKEGVFEYYEVLGDLYTEFGQISSTDDCDALKRAQEYYRLPFEPANVQLVDDKAMLRVARKGLRITEDIITYRLSKVRVEDCFDGDTIDEANLAYLFENIEIIYNIFNQINFLFFHGGESVELTKISNIIKSILNIIEVDFPKVKNKPIATYSRNWDIFFLNQEDWERAAFLNYLTKHRGLDQTISSKVLNLLRSFGHADYKDEKKYNQTILFSKIRLIQSINGVNGEDILTGVLSQAWIHFNRGDFLLAKYFFEYHLRKNVKKVGFFHESNIDALKGFLRSSGRLELFNQAKYAGKIRGTLAKQMNDLGKWSESWSLLAGICIDLQQIDEAYYYLNLASTTSTRGVWIFEGYTLVSIAKEDFPTAFSYLEAELKTWEKINIYPMHNGRVLSLKGRYFNAQKKYQDALKSFQDSFAQYSKVYKDTHPDLNRFYPHLLATLVNLGVKQDINYAITMIHHALNFVLSRCFSAFEILDEDSRYQFLRECRHIYALCNTFVVQHPSAFSSQELVNLTLVMKNICNEATYFHISQLETYSDEYRNLYNEWLELSTQEQIKYPNWNPSLLLTRDGNRKFEIEYELLSLLEKANREGLIERFNIEKIQDKLSDDEAILEYGSFYHTNGMFNENNNFYTDIGLPPKGNFQCGYYYYVSVISKNNVDIYYLGFAEEIDNNIESLIQKIKNCDPLNDEITFLRENLIEPGISLFGDGVNKVYIVPDNNLYRLPFELLLDEKLELMGYLSTSRNITVQQEELSISSVSIFANPDFELSCLSDSVVPIFSKRDTGDLLNPENIASLPWTEDEQEAIQDICQSNGIICFSFTKDLASKTAFETRTGDILHVATHAFTLEKMSNKVSDHYLPFSSSQNPLKRSGLLLAGVSNVLKGEKIPRRYGDGIITAYDILQMDFKDTSVVVLSACQTGLGNHLSGEGIQGFRKSFELSGVNFLICSLWEVDDLATVMFMEKFYSILLQQNHPDIQKAFVRAKELMQSQSFEVYSHPYYWAGFVLQKVGK